MTRKVEVRTPAATFDLLIEETLTETYVDGISNVSMGYPLSKVMLHTNRPPEVQEQPAVEVREAVVRLVIPTGSLLEFALNILKGAAESRDALVSGSNQMSAQFQAFLDQFPEFKVTADEPNPQNEKK
ncbi:hypothetical protein [Burkholderia diffusa]|uniref:hypothetical protein n=1 Tax=Burkholderia diffusa TaxID=488732 RepID=UPI0008419223|nr:hypothetical protein [Burkholderia diffusa]AOI60372.1 hypothetical protein WI26_22640 [Burkholderia diffusa]